MLLETRPRPATGTESRDTVSTFGGLLCLSLSLKIKEWGGGGGKGWRSTLVPAASVMLGCVSFLLGHLFVRLFLASPVPGHTPYSATRALNVVGAPVTLRGSSSSFLAPDQHSHHPEHSQPPRRKVWIKEPPRGWGPWATLSLSASHSHILKISP